MCKTWFIDIPNDEFVCEYLLAKCIIFVTMLMATVCRECCPLEIRRAHVCFLLFTGIAFELVAMMAILAGILTLFLILIEFLSSILVCVGFYCIFPLAQRAEAHHRFPFTSERDTRLMATWMVIAAVREGILDLLQSADDTTDSPLFFVFVRASVNWI